ncbi:MAG: hypothetical protein OSJ73_17295 [Lachnospiraceae bacterium]|jgi:hypothetical protein|nr:hypothetical protein [Lachnospiraceae bacterium]
MKKDGYYYYCKGEESRENNQIETAIQYYLKSVLLEKHFKTYARLYECYFMLNQFDLANYFLTLAYQGNPNNDKVAFQYAMYLIQEKETAMAKKILADIIKRNPTYKHAKLEFQKLQMQQKYQKLIQFLEEIRVDYKGYLGTKSLCLLHCYLLGFQADKLLFKKPKVVEEKEQILGLEDAIWNFMKEFQRWIELKYACKLTQSWSNILRFHTDNEEEAFDLFYQELHIFYQSGIFIEPQEQDTNEKNKKQYCAEDVQIYGQDITLVSFKKTQYNHEFYQRLWKVLTMIKRRPLFLLEEKSLTLTNIFLRGFIEAYNRSHEEEAAYTFFPGFEKWVNQREKLKGYHPWHKIFLFITANQSEAFDLFFTYLEEYLEINS